MTKKQIALLAGGVLLVSGGLLLFSSLMTEEKTASAIDDGKHCPDCGRELPRGAVGDCPFCKMTRVAEGKPAKKETGRSWTITDYFILTMVVFLFGGGGFLIARSVRRIAPRKYRGPKLTHRCPSCKRRVSYTPQQVGREVLCPTCQRVLRLPDAKPKK
jgi:hypothetical protein